MLGANYPRAEIHGSASRRPDAFNPFAKIRAIRELADRRLDVLKKVIGHLHAALSEVSEVLDKVLAGPIPANDAARHDGFLAATRSSASRRMSDQSSGRSS